VIKLIRRSVLAKGQIVIPKTIRDLLSIHVGDKMNIDLQNEKIIISKAQSKEDVFKKVSKKHAKKISMKEIKKELAHRYQDD